MLDTAPASKAGATIDLPPLNIQRVQVTLIGDTPLITHKWSEKAKKEMLDKQMKKAKQAKEAKDPDQDFRDSLYILPPEKKGGAERYGFPVIGFKASAVTACTSIGGMTKVAARQLFHIDGEFAVIEGSEPRKREDMVRVGMGTADIRYRGEFFPWFTRLIVRYNANMGSAEQILNMINTAGFAVGVGEWRPEKDGDKGMFHVATAEEIAALTR
jgi:hypothetical protein